MRKLREKPVGVEAAELVHGDRQQDYGDPLDNCDDIAAKWSVTLRRKLSPGTELSRRDVMLMMIDLKTCRDNNGGAGRDNEIDVCGYAHLMQFDREDNEATRKSAQPGNVFKADLAVECTDASTDVAAERLTRD